MSGTPEPERINPLSMDEMHADTMLGQTEKSTFAS
jgi:hypothetical protein